MTPDAFALVGIITGVVPTLYPQHLPTIFGNQQGVQDSQIGPVNLSGIAQLSAQAIQQDFGHRRWAPPVFSQEPFPTDQVAINKKAGKV